MLPVKNHWSGRKANLNHASNIIIKVTTTLKRRHLGEPLKAHFMHLFLKVLPALII